MRLVAVGIALTGALLLTACGSGGEAPAASTAPAPSTPSATTSQPAPVMTSPTASPVDTATPDPSMSAPPSAAPTAPLVDYGAVLAAWAAHHDADERFDPGAMWDPTPGWGPDDANNDKFNDTTLTGGRVLSYDMYVPRPSVAAAKAIALATATLPADAEILWRQQFPGCYVVELTSATLGAVLAGKPFRNPQGKVQLQLRSGAPTGPAVPFDPATVTSVRVRPAMAASAAAFVGC